MKIDPQMTGIPAEKQAAKAIGHTLQVIRDNPAVAYHCGHCTQTYSLLVEAHATLCDLTIPEIQARFQPAQPNELLEGELRQCPFCGGGMFVLQDDDAHVVRCEDCNARGPEGDDEGESVHKWNQRATLRQ